MINIITGKPGFGKTYSLVHLAIKFLNQGRDVYSNFYIDYSKLVKFGLLKKDHGRVLFWQKVDDLIKIKHGVILMDECQIYFNSRRWKELPEQLQYKLQQHRKHGLDIWGAVQSFKRIDTVLRELVNYCYAVRKILKIFILNAFDPEDIDKVKRQTLSTRVYFFNKKIASCYDTFAEIDSKKI